MAHPSPAAVTAIRAHVSDWTPTDAQIVAALNTPAIANPTPQPSIPAPLTEDGLAGLLTDATNGSIARLVNYVNYGLVQADILAGNRARIGGWAGKLAVAGIITVGEATAIGAALAATVPDPAWPALISWAVANLGRPVDADDVATSRPQ